MIYRIRVGPLDENPIYTMTGENLASEIEQGLTSLQAICQEAEESAQALDINHQAQVSYWWLGDTQSIMRLKADGCITFRRDPSPTNWARVTARVTRKLTQSVWKCLLDIRAGRTPTGFAVKSDLEAGNLLKLSIVCLEDQGCPKCGAYLSSSALKRHLDSPSCRQRVGARDADKKDWVQITDDTTLRAIKDAGIEHETRPIIFATWAPRWALDAAKKYKNNKGFAGMSMKQYLSKLNGG